MVRRPIFEMLTRVTLHYSTKNSGQRPSIFDDDGAKWRTGCSRIIAFIPSRDANLTRFEANRQNRIMILNNLGVR